jgi:hypothetical protein
MALRNAGSRKTYINMVNGNFAIKSEEGVEGAVERTNKNGVQVWELMFSEVEGSIDNIELTSKEFGESIEVALSDGEILNISLDSSAGSRFIKMLPNIDESLPVIFKTWKDDEGKIAFTIKQKDEYVKWAFTRENPNGMPEAVQKTVRGKSVWDYDEQSEFLYNILLQEVKRFNEVSILPTSGESKADVTDNLKEKSDDVSIENVPF